MIGWRPIHSYSLHWNQKVRYCCLVLELLQSVGSLKLITHFVGLEFDDVVVAFSFEHRAWNVVKKTLASLRMCRELYVAVTRAKRRVVILIKKDPVTMRKFFEDLDCEVEELEPDVCIWWDE